MDSAARRLRISVVSRLLGRLMTYQVGINHEVWHLINNPEYRDAWTEQERLLMEKHHARMVQSQQVMSKMTARLRQTKP